MFSRQQINKQQTIIIRLNKLRKENVKEAETAQTRVE